jgi:hypothetical protein
MPRTRHKIETVVEPVRFTAGQIADIDLLVAGQRYGTARGDVIKYFVMKGLEEFDKNGRLKDRRP